MAVPEQIPVVNYVADGIVKKFDVPFEYDQQSDLHVYVDGVEPTIDKYFFADNSFNFYIAPTVGQDVKIKRITPKERDTDYNLHTNTVRPKALNTDFDRLWYVLQEVFSDVGGLSQAVQDEIIARIQGDEDLLNQLTAEISARMLGDEAVTEDLKNYVNQVVGAIIGDPSFTGIDAKNVNDASGETQQQVNYNGGSKWHSRVGGYKLNERVILTNGDIVKSTIPNNTNNPNSDMNGWVKTNSASQIFDESGLSQQQWNDGIESIEALRLLNPQKKGSRVYIVSANKDQNEGGGEFIATQKSGLVDDGGLVVSSPDPLLFWVRINYNEVTPEMFGAKGGNDDDAIALQSSFSHKLPVRLSKHYKTSLPIYYTSNKVVRGTGEGSCSISKTTNNTLSLGNRTINGKVMNFDVDAILVAIPNVGDWYAQYNHLDGFTLNRVGVTKTGIGLYAPLICLSSYKNIVIKNSDIGLKSVDSWMVTWERIHSSSNQPFIFGATDTNWTPNNTSQTFISCWATDATVWAWNVRSMQYSTFESCGADYIGSDGVPADGIFKFVYSDVSLIDCGSEYLHAYHFLETEGSRVRLANYNGQMMYNRYKRSSPTWRTANAMFNVLDRSDVIIEGGRFDFTYNSTHATYGSSCSALAYIEGGSTFIWDDFVRVVADVEDVVSTSSFTWNKFGVYYQNTTGIRVSTRTDVFEIKNTDPAGDAKELLNSTDTHKTFRNFTTTGFIHSNIDNTLENTSLDTIRGLGTISARGQATLANGYPLTGLFNLSQVGNIGAGTATHTSQFLLGIDSSKAYFRRGSWGDAFSSWVEFRTTANTTVDGNGFIKAASPIVQLYADKIELNDEAIQQDIVFEKLGIGDYLIKGSTGFAQVGWYVETPKDANGNVLFSVIYTTLENGDISVKAYKKKFDLETASIVADLTQPVDITAERWIDLRLQELPQITNETQ